MPITNWLTPNTCHWLTPLAHTLLLPVHRVLWLTPCGSLQSAHTTLCSRTRWSPVQYFADRGLFCAGRVDAADLHRVAKATGGVVQSSVNGLTADILGVAGSFEEETVGGGQG